MDKYKVAIVDDDEVALENLSFELGKDVRFSLKGTARNGKQGKKLIAKVQPDLLFLDVEMPDMTGMELLQEIRGTCGLFSIRLMISIWFRLSGRLRSTIC